MKTEIKIIQYDNGIAIEDTDGDGNEVRIVSLERNQIDAIGSVIWEHIKNTMDGQPTNEVTINIEFQLT